MNDIQEQTFSGYKNKLSGSLYGLLCEKENKGKWEEYLDSIYVELLGLEEELKKLNIINRENKDFGILDSCGT